MQLREDQFLLERDTISNINAIHWSINSYWNDIREIERKLKDLNKEIEEKHTEIERCNKGLEIERQKLATLYNKSEHNPVTLKEERERLDREFV
jgi:predicted  nucleic acid-binding Zn-ribbon protein